MREEKKQMQVTEYSCEFCGVRSLSKRKIERHEPKCASQPIPLTPYEWNSEDRGGDDRGIGEFAETLVQDAVYATPDPQYSYNGPCKIELEYPYVEKVGYQTDHLEMRARHAEEIARIVKSPIFMEEVELRANELRDRGIKLVAKWAKEVKVVTIKDLEERHYGDSLDEREDE